MRAASYSHRAKTGEIVIRGDNVTAGYENNPKANAENFTNGWFRTGDQGVMDEEGLCIDYWPTKGNYQSWRRKDLPARSRRSIDGSPRCAAMCDVCYATSQAW